MRGKWGFWFVAIALATVVSSVCSGANAQGSADDERARTHFEAGRLYYEEGNYEAALPEFTRAYELSGRPEMLANIANAAERLGRYSDAADRLAEFHETLPDGHPQRVLLERRIANLRERAAAAAADARSTDTPARDSTTPTVPGPAPGRSAHLSDNELMIPALTTIGVGALGLIGVGILGGMALAEETSIRTGCGATRSCSPEQVATMGDLAIASDVSLTIGLVALAAGVLMIGVGEGNRHPVVDVAFAPWASPGSAGALLSTTF